MSRTLQKKLEALVGCKCENCESAILELQKFPDLPDAGENPQLDQLTRFCAKVKQYKKDQQRLPEPPENMGRKFRMKSGGRLLVNHTGGLIENSNLCFHHTFGFPMIPGSALKGIARAYANENETDRARFARIFGGAEKGQSDEKGNVVFMPAYPADKNWDLEVDVLTSHGGNETKNPVPVFFLTMKKGVTFSFQIRKASSNTSDEDLNTAVNILRNALHYHGVGAKTAAGYGWFEMPESATASVLPEGNPAGDADVAEIARWRYLDLDKKLDEISEYSAAAQKAYLDRMIQEKASLIRRWKNKSNPNFEKIDALAKKFGKELPL